MALIIIGEKLNSSLPKTMAMLEGRDSAAIQQLAQAQDAAGACYIDVNAGQFLQDEAEMLVWLVGLVQEATDKPLCIDSVNAPALKAGLEASKAPALINSISLEEQRFADVSALAMEYGASVIGLCQKADKIPDNAPERIEAGVQLAQKLLDLGMSEERIFLDPLVTAQAVDKNAAITTFQTVLGLKREVPFAKLVCGLSNIGFGLPQRKLVNRSFMAMLVAAGLDGAIMDPLDGVIMAEALVAEMLAGRDKGCKAYLKAVKSGAIG